ncbi:DUF1707 SHOCT-like domain-containing protein [Nocardioides currus]|uniref:DUF1707 SHOCT-like domain-containing protein n=1 Tax=Nocardioides currus TaxID=2133958 RepID=UPI0014040487|nr:DUF1707 domain-containing protein [Nocardioides currus]
MAARDSQVRAGDSDRDEVVALLGDAFAAGRIDYEELHHRTDRAVSARTMGELRVLVRDLGPIPDPGAVLVLNAGLGRQVRSGPWEVPPRLLVTAAVADVRLDFTRAVCPHREVHVEVRPGLGRVRLLVPRSWGVSLVGLRTGWGSVRNDLPPQPRSGRPAIIVAGRLGVGRVDVRRPRFSLR